MSSDGRAGGATSLLLVEDNPGDARLLREALRDLGGERYVLEHVATIHRALERLAGKVYDAVVLDLLLPGTSGLEALRAIRDRARVPIVVVTGFEDERLAIQAVQAGAQDYLIKGRIDGWALDRSLRFAIERHRGERKLESAASLLRATLDATVDGIVAVDADHRVVTLNRRAQEMWGLDESFGPGVDESALLEVLARELVDPARFAKRVAEIHANAEEQSYDLLDLADGRFYERYSTPQILEGGSAGRVWSFHDVTERKHALDAVREHARSSEAASRGKTDFLAFLSHEIRTPLNTILNLAELLDETTINDEGRDYVEILNRAGQHMRSLLDDILDLAKIDSGKLELDCGELDVREIVAEAVAMLSTSARAKGIEIVSEVEERVPHRLLADRLRLRQVLVNLISNALRFTEHGTIRIGVARDPADGRPGDLLFTVADTGIGMPPEALESIFESYVQAGPGIARRFGGTGLGLAICRRLVRQMGGEIEAESRLGEGSTFRFTVTLETLPEEHAGEASPFDGVRFLVATAAESEARRMREALAALRATVEAAGDATHALALLDGAPSPTSFAALVADARLPPKGGFDLLEQARARFEGLERTLLLLPAEHRADDVPRLAELGVGRFLVRPFRTEQLVAALRALLAPPSRERSPAAANARLRLLVADGSPDQRRLVRALLQTTRWTVDEAGNGEEAIARFLERPYDVVLAATEMPIVDGFRTAQAIRGWEAARALEPTPILAIGPHASANDAAAARANGCNGYVPAPLRRDTLVDAIRASLAAPAPATATAKVGLTRAPSRAKRAR